MEGKKGMKVEGMEEIKSRGIKKGRERKKGRDKQRDIATWGVNITLPTQLDHEVDCI